MSRISDIDGEWQQLERLAVELRIAETIAVANDCWFAPTLDDCRIDVERILSGRRAADGHREAHAAILRSEIALRTWRRIVAVTGLSARPRRCACGGRIADVAKAGRFVPFRGLRVEVPADFAIPTCGECGAEVLDDKTGASLDAALLSIVVAQR